MLSARFIYVVLTFWFVCQQSSLASGLIAYDCATPEVNMTTFSLVDGYECPIINSPLQESNVSIQLIQLKKWSYVHVYQCGVQEYVMQLSESDCSSMISTKSFFMNGRTLLDNLQLNSTTTRNVLLAGKVSPDGKCEGASYANHLGSWDNVIVQSLITITLRDGTALLDVDTGKIKLSSGVVCNAAAHNCIDMEYGYTYWSHLSHEMCSSNRHNVLYQGTAQRVVEVDGLGKQKEQPVYVVQDEGISFSFTAKGRTPICGMSLLTTDHPRLLIHHPDDGLFFFKKDQVEVENMDLFAYVNSKFVYVEHHLKSQMKSLYANTMQHKCELEKQIIHNLMNLALISPELFAYSYMKSEGYNAIITGETIQVIKCLPIEVILRGTERCFNDIPVTYRNQSYFISPRNHILKEKGEETPCTPFIYPLFKIGPSWYQFTPKPVETSPPNIMAITTQGSWVYRSPKNLIGTGIYSFDDLDHLREHIMFPAEKKAIVNIVAQSITRMNPDLQKVSLLGMVDDGFIEHMTSSYLKKMWGWFVFLGNMMSGMLGMWMTWKCICFVWDTAVHGISLYQTFGLSLKLFTAVSGSLSTYFLHKAKREPSGQGISSEQDSCTSNNQGKVDQQELSILPLIQPSSAQQHQEHQNDFPTAPKLYPDITPNSPFVRRLV